MSAFFRSGLVATLATTALVAVAGADERAATVEHRGLTSFRHAAPAVAGGGAKTMRDVARTSDCDAERHSASVAGSHASRIGRMDPENARSPDSSPGDTDGGDREGIVPAIYTWKPETRFVFYRNVGKWM